MVTILIDTSILIDHLRLRSAAGNGHPKKTIFERLVEKPYGVAISVVTIQELYEGQSSKRELENKRIEKLLEILDQYPVTPEIARSAGVISRDNDRSVGFADAAIAATAIVQGFQLFTLNSKHFQDIPGIDLFKIESIKS